MSNNNFSLEVKHLNSGYQASQIIFDVTFNLPTTGITALVGRNGAGKTTLLQTLMGFNKAISGEIIFEGKSINSLRPSARAKMGIGYVPQEKPVFADLTVRENLLMGSLKLEKSRRKNIESVLELFPKLAGRLEQKAGTMSGGERKMVGIARALLSEPKLLIMDEPTEGVWQGVVAEIQTALNAYGKEHAILIVEQNLHFVNGMANYFLLLERGNLSSQVAASDKENLAALQERLTI